MSKGNSEGKSNSDNKKNDDKLSEKEKKVLEDYIKKMENSLGESMHKSSFDSWLSKVWKNKNS